MNKRIKKKKAKQAVNNTLTTNHDCSECRHAVGVFYDNTGTCEKNLFLGECNFQPLSEQK